MDLPVLGNNITMLSRFAPGVQVPGTTQFLVQGQVGGGSQYNAPGGVGGNEWSIDGASTNGTDRRVSIMPSPDTIDEFKIETSNFDASFGHSTGLNISMSTKSGSNLLHGTATYQYFNQRLERGVVLRQAGARLSSWPRRVRPAITAEVDRLNATPLLPPGQTRNYHASRQRSRLHPRRCSTAATSCSSSSASPSCGIASRRGRARSNYTVPTEAMRNGDFSPLLAVDPVRYQIYDPLTTRPDPARPGHWVRDPFPGNIIPRDRFDNPFYDFYTTADAVAEHDHRRQPRSGQQLSSPPACRIPWTTVRSTTASTSRPATSIASSSAGSRAASSKARRTSPMRPSRA